MPRAGDVYPIHIRSPAGEASGTFSLPFDPSEIHGLREGLHYIVRGASRGATVTMPEGVQSVDPAELGEQLFNALFSQKALELLRRSEGMTTRGNGLRIRLNVDLEGEGLAELASLPWEFLRGGTEGKFLTLTKERPLVRALDVMEPATPLPFKPPLRILVAIANPVGSIELNLEQEKRNLEALRERMPAIQLDFLEGPSAKDLFNVLAEEDYHVLHYMGHGDYDPKTGRGVLLMESPTGETEEVDGRTLSYILGDEPTLRLVFLNACKTAMASEAAGMDPFAGVATSLIRDAAIPAVVAMQFPITDVAAIQFAETFYHRLALGWPVDAAVSDGRKMIRIASPESMEWATPVLFMRCEDGVLFQPEGETGVAGERESTLETVGIRSTVGTNTASRTSTAGSTGVDTPPEPETVPVELAGLEHAVWLTERDDKLVLHWRTREPPGPSDFVAVFPDEPKAPDGYLGHVYRWAEEEGPFETSVAARSGYYAAYVEELPTGDRKIRASWGPFGE